VFSCAGRSVAFMEEHKKRISLELLQHQDVSGDDSFDLRSMFPDSASAGEQKEALQKLVESGKLQYVQQGSSGQCAGCGRRGKDAPGGKLQKCSRCKCACYCSVQCQTAHWERGHKRLCKQLAKRVAEISSNAEKSEEDRRAMYSTFVSQEDLDALDESVWKDDHAVGINFNKGKAVRPQVNDSSEQRHPQLPSASPWACESMWHAVSHGGKYGMACAKTAALDRCEGYRATMVPRITEEFSIAGAAPIDRVGLINEILHRLSLILMMHFALAESHAMEKAKCTGKTHEPGVIVLESHDMTVERLIGPAASKGSRPVCLHYFSPLQYGRYLASCRKYKNGALKAACDKVKDPMHLYQSQPLGSCVVVAAFAHNQGGICEKRRHKYFVEQGTDCFAFTALVLPAGAVGLSFEEMRKGMELTLHEVGMVAAQTLQIDLADGSSVVLNYDQTNFSLVSVCKERQEVGQPGMPTPNNTEQVSQSASGNTIVCNFCHTAKEKNAFSKKALKHWRQNQGALKCRACTQGPAVPKASAQASDASKATNLKQARVWDIAMDGAISAMKAESSLPKVPGARPSDSMHTFLIDHMVPFNSFAAVHYECDGPGVLFVYTRSSMSVLLSRQRNLDRHVAAMWAPVLAKDGRPSLKYLCDALEPELRFTNLVQKVKTHCNKDTYPMVMVNDPKGVNIPELVRDHVRICPLSDEPALSNSMITMFVSFPDMVAAGRELGYEHVSLFLLNIDRGEDDPV